MPTITAPRLPALDYAASGAYCITICTWKRRRCLGRLGSDGVRMTLAGVIVREELVRTGEIRPGVRLDTFVIMPDHIHAIIWLGPAGSGCRTRSDLRRVVNGIKASATKRWREQSSRADLHLWQPSFYDRVVRSERELAALRKYIIENPMRALARSRAGS